MTDPSEHDALPDDDFIAEPTVSNERPEESDEPLKFADPDDFPEGVDD